MKQIYENNKYKVRSRAKKVRIYKELPHKITHNKTLIKAVTIYLELKPVYYNSLIKDYKRHYSQLAEFLRIGNSTLRAYIPRLIELGLARKEGNHLILCSWEAFRDLFGIETKKAYYVDTENSVSHWLRLIAIKENLVRQEHQFWRKLFLHDQYSLYCQNELSKFKTKGNINLVSRERFGKDLFYKVEKQKVWKQLFNKFRNDPYQIGRATKMALHELERGAEIPSINPEITLSCRGVAKLFNCHSPGAGYYWERKLEDLNLLLVHTTSIRSTDKAILRQRIEGIDLGIYERTTSIKKRKVYFQRLCNKLVPLISEQ